MKKLKRKSEIENFVNLFKKHLSDFVIGAFAFVSALLWRDAIQELINRYRETIQQLIPFEGVILTKFIIALAVTVVAVIAIAIISRFLKNNENI